MFFSDKWYCRQCGQTTYEFSRPTHCPNCGGCFLDKVEEKKKKKDDGFGLFSLIGFFLKWGILAVISAMVVAYKGAKVLFGLIRENIRKKDAGETQKA